MFPTQLRHRDYLLHPLAMSQNKNNRCFFTFTNEDHDKYLSSKDRISFFSWVNYLKLLLHRNPGSSPERFLELFDSIPITVENAYLPSMCFSFLLDRLDGPPSIDLLRCYLKMWRILPEAANELASIGLCSTGHF
jgi:hypothetical protein